MANYHLQFSCLFDCDTVPDQDLPVLHPDFPPLGSTRGPAWPPGRPDPSVPGPPPE